MKKICSIFLLFFLISCSKTKTVSDSNSIDSLNYYLIISNKKEISDQERLKALKNSLRLISILKNNSKNRDSLYNISFKLYNIKRWNDFDLASKKLIKLCLEGKDSLNLVKAYRYRAGFFKNTQIFDSSFYYYIKAEKLYLKQNDRLNYANILLNKGIVQYSVNDFLGADLSLRTAYAIYKTSNDKYKLYGTLNQLGLVSNMLKEYDKAIEYHNEALKLVRNFKLINNEHPEAVCLNNLGFLYLKQKNFKTAIYNFKLALLDDNIIKDDPDLYAYLVDNLAFSKLGNNDLSELPQLFFKSLSIRKKLNNSSTIVGSYINISKFYQHQNQLNLAIKYSNSALEVARRSKMPYDIVLALKELSIVDEKNASKYSKDYIRISDSLQLVESKSKDRFARFQLETDEIIQEKDQLVEKNRNILNYFMGAVIIGGFLFFVRIQRSRSRELVLKQSQQQANEEIYRLIISHQNQLEEGRDLEKRRISKELHDGVLGRLFGLRLNLDGLNNFDDEEARQQRLDYLNELKVIEQDLREISHELNRENLVLINNFVAIINNLLEQQGKINPAKVKSIIAEDIDWDKLPNTAKINLYRILQEALQNINKYANAKNILVHFRKDKKGNLLFNIEDDGVGYDMNSKKSKGIGMKNIVARTQQCQGIIDIKSEIGKGSKIIITFPLENKTIKV